MCYLYSKCINFCSRGYGWIEIMSGASSGWVLVYDRSFTGPETVPPNFRKMKAGFLASAQPTSEQLFEILNTGTNVVLDFRAEGHIFLNGIPMRAMPLKAIADNQEDGFVELTSEDLASELQNLLGKSIPVYEYRKEKIDGVKFANYVKHDIRVTSVQTERDIVSGLGATYINLPVADHSLPSADVVDNFVATWLKLKGQPIIHCQGGKGRTSTAVAMAYYIQSKNGFAEIKEFGSEDDPLSASRLKKKVEKSLQSKASTESLISAASSISSKSSKESQDLDDLLDYAGFLAKFKCYVEELDIENPVPWSAWLKVQERASSSPR